MTTHALLAMPGLTAEVIRIGSALSDDDWKRPTGCPGWSVHDLFTHLTCTFRDITGAPGFPDPVAGAIERTNDAAVAAFRDLTPQQNLEAYRSLVDPALAVLTARQQEGEAERPIDLDDAGVYPLHLMADSLVFDHYCHLAHDLSAPGSLGVHPELDAGTEASAMAASLTWLMAGIPQMSPLRLVEALSAPVALEFSGAGGGRWILWRAEDGSVRTAESGAAENSTAESSTAGDEAAARIACSGDEFIRWGTHRIDWRDADIEFSGDAELARAAADAIKVF